VHGGGGIRIGGSAAENMPREKPRMAVIREIAASSFGDIASSQVDKAIVKNVKATLWARRSSSARAA
jgi:hypothetical protein